MTYTDPLSARKINQEIRTLLPVIGARYGLTGKALKVAMECALGSPAHALECLKAIERSLEPQ